MPSLTEMLTLVGILSAVNQRVVQHLTGAWLSGSRAVIASWVGGYVVTLAAYYFPGIVPGGDALQAHPLGEVLVLGALVGLGSNGVHELFERLIPAVNDHALLPAPPVLENLGNTDPIVAYVKAANQVSIDYQAGKLTKEQAAANVKALVDAHAGDAKYPPLFYPAFMSNPSSGTGTGTMTPPVP